MGVIRFGDQLEITQGVEIGRPSTLFARAEGDAEEVTRVAVAGAAVRVASGSYLLGHMSNRRHTLIICV